MSNLTVTPKIKPVLDPDFVPAVLWNRKYQQKVSENPKSTPMVIALERSDATVSILKTKVLPGDTANQPLNNKYIERLVKLLLWQKGGYKVSVCGDKAVADYIAATYAKDGERKFDNEIMGDRIYSKPFVVEHRPVQDAPKENETTQALGRNLDGCRIGFDLGGSDRKCAAVIDGKVVHSEEVKWDPYFQKDPQYHYDGINDSLKRAAAKMPRVDAIGGSAAGVYVNNEVKVASLFRGIPKDLFDKKVRRMFFDLKKEWNNVPLEVVNDGEVTALAGSMSMNENTILGMSLGTSTAGGYVNSKGNITNWLNELAFVPVDYREGAFVDEWSGDGGCGVQYFSQQAVGRLCAPAGIDLPKEMPLAEKLEKVQELMKNGDMQARKIYETIGVYLGYTLAHFADFYEIRNMLILGRVTSGIGGDLVVATASNVLREEFPQLHKTMVIKTPGESEKRLGQAVAAASLPSLK